MTVKMYMPQMSATNPPTCIVIELPAEASQSLYIIIEAVIVQTVKQT